MAVVRSSKVLVHRQLMQELFTTQLQNITTQCTVSFSILLLLCPRLQLNLFLSLGTSISSIIPICSQSTYSLTLAKRISCAEFLKGVTAGTESLTRRLICAMRS